MPQPEYRHGRIIWAYLRTFKGKKEEHPAVILTGDSEIIQPEKFDPRGGGDNVVVVAGISTKYATHKGEYVRLPFTASKNGHTTTELRKDCAAIIGWYDAVFIPDDVTSFSGDVPQAEMQLINERVLKHYVSVLGKQFATLTEMIADLRTAFIEREFPSR